METYLFIVCLLVVATVAQPNCGQKKNSTGTKSQNGARKITRAINAFSQNLYQKIALGNENVFFSPFSIHVAMSMTSMGAREDTRTELRSTLGLDVFTGNTQSHQAYNDVIQRLNAAPNKTTIVTANAIFINQNRTVENTFIRDVQNYYQSQVSTFDPLDPAGPETVINDYVENKTRGYIQDLIPENTIGPLTLMVIVNTIFFNGSWDLPFPESRTRKADFYTGQGIIQLDTMFDTRTMYIKRNFYGADVGKLSIGDDRFSVYILLPQTATGLPALENALLEPGRLEEAFEGLTPVRVNVSVPKIQIKSTFELNQPMIELGIVQAFSQQNANFTGINRDGDLYISKVIHQAVIEMNEAGTVAAAATAVVISVLSLPPPPTELFLANRPFIFIIRDNSLGMILFHGKYVGEINSIPKKV